MEDERFKSLPPSGRALVKTLLDIVEQILSGRCDEEEIEDVSRRVNPDMKGYKCEDDYVTIDEGMRIMHYNRNRLIVLKHKLDEDCARRKHRGEIQRMRDNEYTNKSNNT